MGGSKIPRYTDNAPSNLNQNAGPVIFRIIEIHVKVIRELQSAYLIKEKTDRNEFRIPLRSRNF